MTPVFADSGYWIALNSGRDALHSAAISATARLGSRLIVTSEMVLTEVLDGGATQGTYRRTGLLRFVEDMRHQGRVRVIPQTPELFVAALELYKQRLDKEWSLTDCASFVVCGQEGIVEVLAHDHHFQQAGFVTLL